MLSDYGPSGSLGSHRHWLVWMLKEGGCISGFRWISSGCRQAGHEAVRENGGRRETTESGRKDERGVPKRRLGQVPERRLWPKLKRDCSTERRLGPQRHSEAVVEKQLRM